MPRLFLPHVEPSHEVRILGDKARYLHTVLRCKPGDTLTLFNGKGCLWRATLTSVTKNEVLAETGEPFSSAAESSLEIVLIQGLLKGEKMDVVMQKTTELGVMEIIPVITERSQIRATGRIARWRKIVEEASRQSNRTMVPIVHEVIYFKEVLLPEPKFNLISERDHIKGILFLENEGIMAKEALNRMKGALKITIAIGPEGGFSEQEVEIAKSGGLLITSLGTRILRAETAAIAALAIIQYVLGDMGNDLSATQDPL
jgi:16S rRNA (uracil1498-N3)-methyltransferase